MSFANVFLGNTAGDGTGDPIRVAFQKINLNFANIAAGNITVNAPVNTVAGRTGNVVLTVSDVASAASTGYVDAVGLSSNVYALGLLGNVTSNVQAIVSANLAGNITALLTSNSAVANITSNVNAAVTTAVYANITNIVGTVVTGNLAQINANVVGSNAAIVTANTAMKGYVDAVTTAWTANAVTQLGQIAGANAAIVTANTALKSYTDAQITTANTALKSYVDTQVTNLTANAGAQANSLLGANAAIVTANSAMKLYVDAVSTAWAANAATQQGNISAINANIGGFYTWANTNFGTSNYSNTTVAAYLPTASVITTLQANTGGLYNSILGANAAIVTANTAMKSYVDAVTTAWTANAASQAGLITTLQSNAGAQADSLLGANAAIITANTALKSYVDAQNSLDRANITTATTAITALQTYYTWANANVAGLYNSIISANVAWQANSTAQQASINSLLSNAAVQDSAIISINSNITAANAQIGAISYTVGQLSGLGGAIPTLANLAQITAANAAIAQTNANVAGANAAITSGFNTVNNSIGILQGQATSFTGSINSLQANSVSQESSINSLSTGLTGANAAIVTANTAMKAYVDTANTVQSGQIATLVAQVNNVSFYSNASAVAGWLSSNVASLSGNLVTANTAMKGYVDAVTTAWTANAVSQQSAITTLQAQVNGPVFMATQTTGQALSTIGVVKEISLVFDTVERATPGGLYNTSTGIFTPNVAGYYQVSVGSGAGTANTSANLSTFFYATLLYKNTSIVGSGSLDRPATYPGGWVTSLSQTSRLVYLNGSTDYIRANVVYFNGSSGSGWNTYLNPINTIVPSYFQATWIRGA